MICKLSLEKKWGRLNRPFEIYGKELEHCTSCGNTYRRGVDVMNFVLKTNTIQIITMTVDTTDTVFTAVLLMII
jgi:hypothetical protein